MQRMACGACVQLEHQVHKYLHQIKGLNAMKQLQQTISSTVPTSRNKHFVVVISTFTFMEFSKADGDHYCLSGHIRESACPISPKIDRRRVRRDDVGGIERLAGHAASGKKESRSDI